MEWEIKIEDKPKERLLAKFRPLYGIIEICGQYRIKNSWVDFSMAECSITEITLESLQKALGDAFKELKIQIEKYEDLEKTFKAIGSINFEEPIENPEGEK